MDNPLGGLFVATDVKQPRIDLQNATRFFEHYKLINKMSETSQWATLLGEIEATCFRSRDEMRTLSAFFQETQAAVSEMKESSKESQLFNQIKNLTKQHLTHVDELENFALFAKVFRETTENSYAEIDAAMQEYRRCSGQTTSSTLTPTAPAPSTSCPVATLKTKSEPISPKQAGSSNHEPSSTVNDDRSASIKQEPPDAEPEVDEHAPRVPRVAKNSIYVCCKGSPKNDVKEKRILRESNEVAAEFQKKFRYDPSRLGDDVYLYQVGVDNERFLMKRIIFAGLPAYFDLTNNGEFEYKFYGKISHNGTLRMQLKYMNASATLQIRDFTFIQEADGRWLDSNGEETLELDAGYDEEDRLEMSQRTTVPKTNNPSSGDHFEMRYRNTPDSGAPKYSDKTKQDVHGPELPPPQPVVVADGQTKGSPDEEEVLTEMELRRRCMESMKRIESTADILQQPAMRTIIDEVPLRPHTTTRVVNESIVLGTSSTAEETEGRRSRTEKEKDRDRSHKRNSSKRGSSHYRKRGDYDYDERDQKDRSRPKDRPDTATHHHISSSDAVGESVEEEARPRRRHAPDSSSRRHIPKAEDVFVRLSTETETSPRVSTPTSRIVTSSPPELDVISDVESVGSQAHEHGNVEEYLFDEMDMEDCWNDSELPSEEQIDEAMQQRSEDDYAALTKPWLDRKPAVADFQRPFRPYRSPFDQRYQSNYRGHSYRGQNYNPTRFFEFERDFAAKRRRTEFMPDDHHRSEFNSEDASVFNRIERPLKRKTTIPHLRCDLLLEGNVSKQPTQLFQFGCPFPQEYEATFEFEECDVYALLVRTQKYGEAAMMRRLRIGHFPVEADGKRHVPIAASLYVAEDNITGMVSLRAGLSIPVDVTLFTMRVREPPPFVPDRREVRAGPSREARSRSRSPVRSSHRDSHHESTSRPSRH